MKQKIVYIILGALTFAIIILIAQEIVREKEFQWYPNYNSKSTEPYGSSILFSHLSDLFPDKNVEKLEQSFLLKYKEHVFKWQDFENTQYKETTDTSSGEVTYEQIDSKEYKLPYLKKFEKKNVFLINRQPNLTDFDYKALLLHIYQGNDALIALDYFDYLEDDFDLKINTPKADDDSIMLCNKIVLDNNEYLFTNDSIKRFGTNSFFDDSTVYDKVVMKNGLGKPVAIEVKYGRGKIIFCTTPILFTNYYMLKPHRQVIAQISTKLSNEDLLWCNDYYNYNDPSRDDSLLSFIMKNPPLKWAFLVLLAGIIAFMLLELKRKQNPIPILQKPENTSLRFSETIAQLYFKGNNHAEIAHKKIAYFLEYLRLQYGITTSKFDANFYFALSERSGYTQEALKKMFYFVRIVKDSDDISKQQLKELNTFIYKFKNGKKLQ